VHTQNYASLHFLLATPSIDATNVRGGPTMSERCDTTATAAVYGSGAHEYDELWSPVILPPAQAMIAALDLHEARTVLDVGGGTGALSSALSAAAPHALVTVVDPAWEMLHYAVTKRTVIGTQGDASALPFPSSCVDAVVLAYVLFHLTNPSTGLEEAARVLRPGGKVGTVTWAREWSSHAADVWDQTLQELEVPDLPAHGNHTGLDSPAAIDALLADAAFQTVRAWHEDINWLFDASQFWKLRTRHGRSRARLALLDETTRTVVLDELHERLVQKGPAAYAARGRLVCAVATCPA
jgi:ubiquinone/menaquinone biosynthesis C-methylase UbiE